MALNSLFCADVLLSNYSLTAQRNPHHGVGYMYEDDVFPCVVSSLCPVSLFQFLGHRAFRPNTDYRFLR